MRVCERVHGDFCCPRERLALGRALAEMEERTMGGYCSKMPVL